MDRLFVTARSLPVPHGFSLRQGGVSQGAHASLNFGWNVGDSDDNVQVNFERLAQDGRFELGLLHTLSQVHGDRVVEAKGRALAAGKPAQEADAVWTREADVA